MKLGINTTNKFLALPQCPLQLQYLGISLALTISLVLFTGYSPTVKAQSQTNTNLGSVSELHQVP